ncbi:MAG TPA: hypothetical protein VFR35_16740 [Actinoplanes sp.]|nr:hypothetical protein [Actinoplanes sp.]
MKFILEVDMARFGDGDAGRELGRILRYWGGAMDKVELNEGAGAQIYDSEYHAVGHWIVTDAPDS